MGYRDQNLLLNYSHPWFPIVSVVVYVFLVFTLPKLLKNLPPLKLKLFVALWNLGLSLFSFCVVIGVGEPYLQVYLNVFLIFLHFSCYYSNFNVIFFFLI